MISQVMHSPLDSNTQPANLSVAGLILLRAGRSFYRRRGKVPRKRKTDTLIQPVWCSPA